MKAYDYQVGDEIRHRTLGVGKVQEVSPKMIRVGFHVGGDKYLLLRWQDPMITNLTALSRASARKAEKRSGKGKRNV